MHQLNLILGSRFIGNKKRIKSIDYNSDGTNQLKIQEIVKLLKKTKIDLN